MHRAYSNLLRALSFLVLSGFCWALPIVAFGFSSVFVPIECFGTTHVRCAYDGTSSSISGYDCVAVLTPAREEIRIAEHSHPFFEFTDFLAVRRGAYSGIGSTGQVGERWLAENIGGRQNAFFRTSQGARFVDNFANGIANESKVGYQSLTPSIQLQISKDAVKGSNHSFSLIACIYLFIKHIGRRNIAIFPPAPPHNLCGLPPSLTRILSCAQSFDLGA
jgi:hypothetical protein